MFSRRDARRWAIASTVSLLVGCGSENLEQTQELFRADEQEIVGGTNTTIEANPWQVSLQSSSGSHFCGGSVISADWILTAQHCVTSGAPGRVVAGITTRSSSSTGQIRTVAQLVRYPGYVDANQGKDVALLKLSSPLDLSGAKVKAIPIVTAANAAAGVTNPGVVARVTGWGTLTSGGSTLPDTLQTVDVNVISNSQAQSSYPQETIGADQIGGAAPGKDSCQGDSGGPFTVLNGSTRALAGVVSWGYGCADPQYPGMYARVSEFESWITSTMAGGGGGGGCTPVALSNGVAVTGISAGAGAWTCSYTLLVPAGASNLAFNLSGGTGDGDMYVKFGAEPTSSSYDCRPYLGGNNESCTFAAPSAGTYYVKINGYSAASGMSLVGSYTAGGGGGGGTPTTETRSGSVASSAWSPDYTFSVKAGTQFKVDMTGSGDPDLYVRWGAAPTTATYNCRPYLNGATESCTLTVPTGTTSAYVKVRGFTAASYNLTINYTKP